MKVHSDMSIKVSSSLLDMEFDYIDALRRQNILESDVMKLRDKVSQNEIVPQKISLKKLLLFLNACDGVDDAAVVIGKYYEIRKSCPSIFSNRDPLSAQVQQCLSNQYYFSLPTTPTGFSVIYHSLSNSKPSNYVYDEACKTFFMLVECVLNKKGPSNGLIIVFDLQFMGMRHLMRPSIEGLRAYFRFLQEALPIRLERMIIMNAASYFDMLLMLIKPFMKSEILNKMVICRGTNFDQLYEILPTSCLPSEFGGELASIQELHDTYKNEFARLQNFFVEEEKEANLE